MSQKVQESYITPTKPSKALFDAKKYFSEYLDKKVFYVNPFEDVKGEQIQLRDMSRKDSCTIDSIITAYESRINNEVKEFLSGVSREAAKIYEHEHRALKDHEIVTQVLWEWIYEMDTAHLRENNELRKKLNIPEDRSVYDKNRLKYSPGMEEYEKEKEQLLSELEYYGSNVPYTLNQSLKLASLEELQRHGLKSIDCISFILECMTRSTGKNHFLRKLSDAKGISEYMRSKGFETIFIAENILLKEKKYEYNADFKHNSYVKDYINNIRNNKYYVTIDYMTTGRNITSPAFREFVSQTKGIVLMQEGYHSGILIDGINGKLLDAHYSNSPLYNNVFQVTDFIKKFDNDDTKHDYQSAVLFVPKGSVEAFMARNYSRFEKEPNVFEKEQLKDSLVKQYYARQKRLSDNIILDSR